MFEISDGALIEGNVVWENGWGGPAWGWGAGILVSSSTDTVVRDNVVARNADGVSIISQRRERAQGDDVRGVRVEGNTIVEGPGGGYLLAWLQDWDGPMFAADAGNVGEGNAFQLAEDAASACHFEWDGCRDSVETFASTPGGAGSQALSADAGAAALSAVGLDAPPSRTWPSPRLRATSLRHRRCGRRRAPRRAPSWRLLAWRRRTWPDIVRRVPSGGRTPCDRLRHGRSMLTGPGATPAQRRQVRSRRGS